MFTGPSRSILARRRAIASSALSVRSAAASAAAGLGRLGRRPDGVPPSSVPLVSSARITRASGVSSPSRSSASTSASTSSSVAWTDSTQVSARWDRSLSAVARATSSSATSDLADSSVARAVLITASMVVGRTRSVDTTSSAVCTSTRSRSSERYVGIELRLAGESTRRSSSSRWRVVCSSEPERRRGPRARRRLLEPLHFRAERRRALDQGGVRGAGFGGPAAQRSAASRASNSRRCASGQPLVGGLLFALQPDDRRPRLVLAPLEAVALLLGLPALARQLLALLASRAASSLACCSCAS